MLFGHYSPWTYYCLTVCFFHRIIYPLYISFTSVKQDTSLDKKRCKYTNLSGAVWITYSLKFRYFLITFKEDNLLVLSLYLQLSFIFNSSLTFPNIIIALGYESMCNCSINPHILCLQETRLLARYLYHSSHLLMGQ